ncbi:zinc finger protein 488 isoform X2 [Elephas maximus indicus]|uniref:zinc finger protein 488 isoform X2 n=1 Tax=Elephas maximus indicus TaxID=99487 RepID=UPI002115F637|nr:zinc finger protein 488 isoform X2 [Elephas maximus indicus]
MFPEHLRCSRPHKVLQTWRAMWSSHPMELPSSTLQSPTALKTNGQWSDPPCYTGQGPIIQKATGKESPPTPLAEIRWGLREPEPGQGCKPVLLEKTNHLGPAAGTGSGGREAACAELVLLADPGKFQLGKLLPREALQKQRQSAFMEAQQLKERLGGNQAQRREHNDPTAQPGCQQLTQDVPACPVGNTVVSVWPSRARGGQRSAFSKPTKCPAEKPGPPPVFPANQSADSPGDLSGIISSADLPHWSQFSNANFCIGDFWNLQMLPQNVLLSSAFLGGSTLWLKHKVAQIPMPSCLSSASSLTHVPLTFTKLGLCTQNWCAKCSLSFHLTSDLVFHMRSHHKREHAGPDLHSKKQGEEALACPVCHEHFQERHHLSRHMTSHS